MAQDDPVRILVVDDEEAVRNLFILVLADLGLVDAAHCGQMAVDMASETSYQLVVLDKNLPDMSGVEVLRQIRKFDERIRAVMLTGYGSVESALEIGTLGVDGYLEKPLEDIVELRSWAETSLERLHQADKQKKERAPTEPGDDEAHASSLMVGVLIEDEELGSRLAVLLTALGTAPQIRSQADAAFDIVFTPVTADGIATVRSLCEELGQFTDVVAVLDGADLGAVKTLLELDRVCVIDPRESDEVLLERLNEVVSRKLRVLFPSQPV